MVENRSNGGNSLANAVIMEILSRHVASKLKLHLNSPIAPRRFPSFCALRIVVMSSLRTCSIQEDDNERGASDLDAYLDRRELARRMAIGKRRKMWIKKGRTVK